MSADTSTVLDFDSSSRVLWGSRENFSKVLTCACKAADFAAIDQLLSEWENSPGSLYVRGHRYKDLDLVLRKTIKSGQLDVAAYLIENGLDITSKVANLAARAHSIEMLEWLLAHGWNMNGISEFPYPSLNGSRGEYLRGQVLILESSTAIELNSVPIVRWYLVHGALINSPFSNACVFRLPVTTAAKSASLKIIQLLVSHGADLSKGDVIISAMSSSLPDRASVLQYLLEQGAPANELYYEWNTKLMSLKVRRYGRSQAPLHIAVDQDKWLLVNKLVKFGASWDKEDSDGMTPRDIANKRGKQHLIYDYRNTSEIDRPIKSML